MKDQLSFVSVVTMITSIIFTPELAAVIGPYAVILIAASTGAAFGLGRRGPSTRMDALRFYIRMNFLAALLTILICNLLETYVFRTEVKWALIPVALAIGWIGDDWPRVFAWVMDAGKRAALRWATSKEKNDVQ